MIPFQNALMLAAGAQGKSYADWVAHIATRTSTVRAWLADFSGSETTGVETVLRTTADGQPTNGMYGSPYNGSSIVSYNGGAGNWSPVARVVLHSMPSLAAFNSQVSAGGQLLLRATQLGVGAAPARDRNGYQSIELFDEDEQSQFWPIRQRLDEASYWNFATGAPETVNPFAGTEPVPYSHASW